MKLPLQSHGERGGREPAHLLGLARSPPAAERYESWRARDDVSGGLARIAFHDVWATSSETRSNRPKRWASIRL